MHGTVMLISIFSVAFQIYINIIYPKEFFQLINYKTLMEFIIQC